MEQSKEEFNKPFKYEEELAAKLKRQFELNAELDMDKGGDEILGDDDSMKEDELDTDKEVNSEDIEIE